MKKNAGSLSAGETRSEIKAREHFQKVVSERITLVEKYFVMLSKDIGSYAASLESVRDKGAKLSATVDNYADEEYSSTKECLAAVAENFATVQDYAGAQVDFLQAKVVQPLSLYTTNCKLTKDYMKGMTTAREKEVAKYKMVEKLKAKEPSHSKKLSQAEQELQKVSVDANRARQTLEEQMVVFEKKRIQDLKNILGNLFHGQMLYHAKALETFTKAYQNLMAIDEENDLEAFQNSLYPPSTNRLDVVRSGSQTSLNCFSSQGSLGSQLSLGRTGQSMGLQDDDDDSDFD